METSIMVLIIVLILFCGLSFLIVMNSLKKIAEDVEEMRIDHQQKEVSIELDRAFEHKMPTPKFYEPVSEIRCGDV